MKYTIFLDRDGVINIDSPDYIKKRSEFHFISGSCEAVSLLYKNGFNIIIITNQSAVARKMITTLELEKIFKKMEKRIKAHGGRIKDIFYCPHLPKDNCSCRKPRPGLIFQAAEKYNINLANSCMVGDSIKDIECGKNAGCGAYILIDEGKENKKIEKELKTKNIKPDLITKNLASASKWIIGNIGVVK
ncbi:MAG: D-glycero-beta-D-manno-heptose-1,7-bisphosphate 7-phosphatase [Desulfobacteraceae bacterium 4572_130]|nr:MAG: D-glycero-beta-D-manno-heptose-1,7-bisphosphate 7-phosphatase [Desulfobacteraceae bacterium 4572_130]